MGGARQLAVAALVGAALGMACSVRFNDDVVYSCTSDADCAGDGFSCTARAGGVGACCKPSGPEVCGDARDNDCDGRVDAEDDPNPERCNGADDDCDGVIDNGFNLATDSLNCGACGNACGAGLGCAAGTCGAKGESECSDGADNDGNGKTDCADPSCNLLSCGQGCLCQGLRKSERACSDGADNDGDSTSDCADPDCLNVSCGAGCQCLGGVRTELACDDASVDNDSDGLSDCDDPDCAGQLCMAGTGLRCGGGGCQCNDGGVVDEAGPALCRDRLDNDCDLLVDCQEAGCDQLSCATDGGVAPDGGASCVCVAGARREGNCGDRRDNDDDGFTDCGDPQDCPAGSACTYVQGNVRNGTCTAGGICQ